MRGVGSRVEVSTGGTFLSTFDFWKHVNVLLSLKSKMPRSVPWRGVVCCCYRRHPRPPFRCPICLWRTRSGAGPGPRQVTQLLASPGQGWLKPGPSLGRLGGRGSLPVDAEGRLRHHVGKACPGRTPTENKTVTQGTRVCDLGTKLCAKS